MARGDKTGLAALLGRLDVDALGEEASQIAPSMVALGSFVEQPSLVLLYGRTWMEQTYKIKQPWQRLSQMQTVLRTCWPALGNKERRTLADTFVRAALDTVDKNPRALVQLAALQKELDAELLTDEQVTALLKTIEEKKLALPINAFVLFPESKHGELLLRAWEKASPSSRPWFLLSMIRESKGPLAEEQRTFIQERWGSAVESFPREAWTLSYSLDGALDSNPSEAPLLLELVETLAERDNSESLPRVVRAAILRRLERMDEAIEIAKSVLRDVYEVDPQDWQRANAARQLIDVFLPSHIDEAHALLDPIIEERGFTPMGLEMKERLLREAHRHEELLALYDKALETDPTNEVYLQRRVSEIRRRGIIQEELKAIQSLVAAHPDKPAHKRRLSSLWKRLRHPIRAEAVKKADAPAVEATTQEKRPKMEKPTIDALVKAVDAKDDAHLRLVLHQLWRGLGQGTSVRGRRGPVYVMTTSGLVQMNHDMGARGWQIWPEEEGKRKKRVVRGGLPDFADLRKRVEEAEQRVSTYEVLADHDVAVAELRRRLRVVQPSPWTGAQLEPLYKGLAKARMRIETERGAVDGLLARQREGRLGIHDLAELLFVLEQAEAIPDEDVASMLDEVATTVGFSDVNSLRRLARVNATAGRADVANEIYGWIAAFRPTSAQAAIRDAMEVLDGEALHRALDILLAAQKPKEVAESLRDPWAQAGSQDAYVSQLLETWGEVLEPEEVLDRYRDECASILDTSQMLRRQGARAAAFLYARVGEHKTALKALEIAIARWPDWKAPHRENDPSWSWRKQMIERGARNGSSLSALQMDRLFPDDLDGWADGAGWLNTVATQVLAWGEAGRLPERTSLRMLAVLAARLHRAGQVERAQGLARRLKAREGLHPADQLWVVDALRQTGAGAEADEMERALLATKSLHLERVVELLDRIHGEEGVMVAIEKAIEVSAWTHAPKLLERLIAWHVEVGERETAQKWLETARTSWPDEDADRWPSVK